MSITLNNAEVGDVIRYQYKAGVVKNSATTDCGEFRCVLTENGGAAVPLITETIVTGADYTTPSGQPWVYWMGHSGRYVSTIAGPVVVKLQWSATAGTLVLNTANRRSLSAMLVRP